MHSHGVAYDDLGIMLGMVVGKSREVETEEVETEGVEVVVV